MKNILIVEDEAIVRESLRDWLTDLGYNVEVARQGEEALEAIEQREFDVVLLDLRLPGKDGIEVLREARLKKPKLNGIIITAHPTVKTAVDAMKLGAIDFMTKPIDLSGLEKLIKSKTESDKAKMKPILIVDDETVMRESLRDWFAESGYHVDTAADGETALKRIADKEYGVLVIDLKLPGKSGIEVLKESRKHAPDLKVIIITAYPSVDTAVEAMRQGAVEYLSKPFALTDLEKLVADNIERAHVEMIQEPVTKHTIAALLKVLDRAAADSRFLSRMAESPQEALAEYPDLTGEEREALIDGDMKKIESWVGTLDKERATWLWCRLSQERW